ncbi:sigma 54-interacting transcriptional regulator [Irregularibacter muris]|uniref:Sigma 54-interacting transcriptional regulator n=1 Tax=Irregularibacter muris TaxID=1796619 RepID=A0AAE3HFW4_9FIRM|nr:sigma-54-dependent transcriptional regulator [Irregularibacter muris]MCR1898279.1 sigma 54-interacting transcriptional regulator [Irregularibacter muris]
MVRENDLGRKNPSKRKDKIKDTLTYLTRSLYKNESNITLSELNAEYIGSLIGVSRANASRELNKLFREDQLIKISGRPVVYIDKKVTENKYKYKFNNIFKNIEEFNLLVNYIINKHADKDLRNERNDINQISRYGVDQESRDDRIDCILNNMIGATESMKGPIELAKAAIIYPPRGLHTLIVGQTGVGKSIFAEAMYDYAVKSGVFSGNVPFILFNCADYSDNPQLLLSQLFGHIKGAFTGAEKDKSGLVEQADGGILFLDEVHRLPPKGQEMLFILMDKGMYRRLGETKNIRHSQVLIISATTEDPKSTMLDTFLRRIPVTIEIPSLENRSIKERIDFILQFFWDESRRVQTPLRVTKEVFRAFMFYHCIGNIGQLKGDIQLICAKAFLDHMSTRGKWMDVKLSHLSAGVQEGLFKIRENRQLLLKNPILELNNDVFIDGTDEKFKNSKTRIIDNQKYNIDYYECIVNNWYKYSNKGYEENKVKSIVVNQLEKYLQNAYESIRPKNVLIKNEVVSNIVGKNIFQAVEYALHSVEDIFGEFINEKTLYGLALHINNLYERLSMGNFVSHPNRFKIAHDHPQEFKAAQKIKNVLEKKLSIKIPDDEAAFIAMLLYAIRTTKDNPNIGVLVIAHGKNTASSMVSVANTLLGVDHAKAIDMPLEQNVEAILEIAIQRVKELDMGKGVLILVDMGSLTSFSHIITEKYNIRAKSIDRVSTPMVIEATRKAMMPNISLDELVEEIKSWHGCMKVDEKEKKIDNPFDYFETNLINILDNTLIFLNPQKTFKTLRNVLCAILKDMDEKLDNDILVKFLFHCSCMIERVIKNEVLPYKYMAHFNENRKEMLSKVSSHFVLVEETFGVCIPKTELAHIIEIFDTHFSIHI